MRALNGPRFARERVAGKRRLLPFDNGRRKVDLGPLRTERAQSFGYVVDGVVIVGGVGVGGVSVGGVGVGAGAGTAKAEGCLDAHGADGLDAEGWAADVRGVVSVDVEDVLCCWMGVEGFVLC